VKKDNKEKSIGNSPKKVPLFRLKNLLAKSRPDTKLEYNENDN
jgi:hypothetical protein